ncbi:MAG: alcohol dehydrogenase catalytic domain-containing protein [Candidatus Limnocylindrales bacterium]
MKAIAIRPGTPGSVHLRELPRPSIEDVPGGRGVRVSMIRAGLCGTDADLVAGEYGMAPPGEDHLVLGHESLGRVTEVGPAADVPLGRLVVITIRRPGSSAYDRIGRPDLSTDAVFTETGISRAHGFMCEELVVEPDHLVPVPDPLEDVAILTEPLSCITKSLRQADQVQSRLDLWEPRRALVTGAGTIGLLATLALRLRGLDVTTFARRQAPYRNSRLVERTGARYAAAADVDLSAVAERDGPFDIVFEGSGAPALIEPAVSALAPNGVVALFSVTPGSRPLTVDMARLNQSLVLYNRVIVGSAAAAREDYAAAVGTIGQAQAEEGTRGWLGELLTDRIEGFDVEAVARHLVRSGDHIKATVEIA